MSPEEEAELQQLRNQFAPEQQETWSRFGKQVANTGNTFLRGMGRLGVGMHNLLSGDTLSPEAGETGIEDVARPYNLAPASGIGQIAADAAGSLPSELAQYFIGSRAVGGGAGILNNVAAGGLLGLRENRPLESAAEFGAMSAVGPAVDALPLPGPVKSLLRVAGNAAIPVASAELRGENPYNEQTLVQAGLQGVLGSGLPEAASRRLFRSRPTAPVAETMRESPPATPETLALDWPHGEARNYSPSGEPIVIDPTLGEQGQLRLPGPTTDPSGRPWNMIEWPYGGGQGIPLPEPAGTRPRMAIKRLLSRGEPPVIDVPAEVRPDPLATTAPAGPEIQSTIGDLVEPQVKQEPSAGRISALYNRWKLETDPTAKSEIFRQMKALEDANPPGMKLGDANESGAVSLPAASALAGGGIGGLIGYATGDDPDDRANRALLFGGVGLAAGGLAGSGRSLLRLSNPTERTALAREAVQPTAGVPRTLEQKAARFLEQYHPSVSPEVFRAMERAKGKESFVRGLVDDAAEPFFKIAPHLTPAHTAVGDTFLNSSAKPADIAGLDASSVPQPYKDFLKASKAAQIEGQRTLLKGESDPKKRLTIASTVGSWATRQYRAIIDPESHVMDPATFQKVADQWAQSPEFRNTDREIVEQALSQHIGELGQRGGSNLKPSDPRISGTLYKNRKDFAPHDWDFLDTLSKDPSLKPSVQSFLADMVSSRTVDMGDQAFLKTLAGQKSIYHTDAARLRELADKQVLTPEYRSLLGEITDPVQRQMLSVNKIANSVRGAEAFNQLSQSKFPDGRRMVYTPQELAQAKTTATGSQLEAFKDYTPLPDNPALGKLSGKMVPRDAADAINAMYDKTKAHGALRATAMLNSWVKEAITVLNPSTQIRQFAQIPFFAATARVYPHELPKYIGDYARVMRDTNSALRKEMVENHVTNANFAQNDLLEMERRVAGEQPNLLERGRAAARKTYRIPDDLVRGVAYLKHKDVFLEEAAAKGMTGDAANEYAKNKTLDFLRDYTMNYGALPQSVNVAKHIPVVSPFISYSYEMARITKNLLRDVAKGSASDKVHAGAALAALYALPTALSIFGKNVLLNKEDRADWEKIQDLLPTSQRQQFKLPIGREKDGTFKSIALNSWMPAADLASLVRSAVKGDWETILEENPIAGMHKNPLVSAAMDVGSKENYFTHEEIKTGPQMAGRAAEALLPPWAPPAGYQFKKLMRSFTPNAEGGLGVTSNKTGYRDNPTTGLLSTVGVSTQYANPRNLLRRAQGEATDKLDREKQGLKRIMQSNRTDKDKQEQVRLFQIHAQQIQREFQEKTRLVRTGND